MEEKEKKETKKQSKTKKSNNAELDALKISYNELNEKFLRVMAEMQNIKRRNDEEISRIRKFEGEDIVSELLNVSDNFDRALFINGEVSDETKKFLDGFVMINAQLKSILTNKNVLEIDCKDKEFDPNVAEAVLTESIEDKEPNIVTEVMQKGYTFNGKVIRPAMVKVSE